MKAKKNLFFVYGTLKVGGRFDRFKDVRLSSKPATIAGTMYSVDGAFPALKLGGKGVVTGELHEIDPKKVEEVAKDFDRIEGCNGGVSDHNFYNRKRVTVQLESGETEEAWVYEFNRPTDKLAKVSSGVWPI